MLIKCIRFSFVIFSLSLGLSLSHLSVGHALSTISTYFNEEQNIGGWTISIDESEEAHGLYESLQVAPDCGSSDGRCWKYLALSNGFNISAMKLTYTNSKGRIKTVYGFIARLNLKSLAEFKELKFPLRLNILEGADQDKLIAALPEVQDGIQLLLGRVYIICNSKKSSASNSCFLDIRSLNYVSVKLGKESVDLESVTRGTPYSNVMMPNLYLSLNGEAADRLYDSLQMEGGPHLVKEVTISPTAKLTCRKRPKASDPYTVCVFYFNDETPVPLKFPETTELKYLDSKNIFPTNFKFNSNYGIFSMNCSPGLANQICKIKTQYLP